MDFIFGLKYYLVILNSSNSNSYLISIFFSSKLHLYLFGILLIQSIFVIFIFHKLSSHPKLELYEIHRSV